LANLGFAGVADNEARRRERIARPGHSRSTRARDGANIRQGGETGLDASSSDLPCTLVVSALPGSASLIVTINEIPVLTATTAAIRNCVPPGVEW
jgi:hypothetical protein